MPTSGELIREARLRASLTQAELGARTGKDRAQVARWEREAVQPSFETLRLLLRACGYDLSADLVPYAPEAAPNVDELARLTPHERLARHDERRQDSPEGAGQRWAPLELVATLERRRVAYVLIGTLARVLHGTDEIADAVEICPGMSDSNRRRLEQVLADLEVSAEAPVARAMLETTAGRLVIDPEPAGTRGGHDDLRRRANRDPLGAGLRAPVANVGDLARIAAAEANVPPEVIAQLRSLQERDRGVSR